MTDEIPVCPECDHAHIRRRTDAPDGGVVDGNWYCRDCGGRFDQPASRESESNRPVTRGLAARLADDLEPGDLVSDGGFVDERPHVARCRSCGWRERYEGTKWKLPGEQARNAIGAHRRICDDCDVAVYPVGEDGSRVRVTDGGQSSDETERYSVEWDYGPVEQQHIRDVNRAEDRPDGLTLEVDDGTVTATGTAETIRWLYDCLHHLKRAWRHEGEQWDADAAEDMAESLYEQVDGDLPERKRTKEALTDGGNGCNVQPGTDHSGGGG